jgi:uncharacterized protein
VPEFEYDAEKNASNKAKHGVDFEQALALWNDPNHVIVELEHPLEKRFIVIAKLSANDANIYAAIFTYRGDRVRLISVRRASNRKEIPTYGKSQDS